MTQSPRAGSYLPLILLAVLFLSVLSGCGGGSSGTSSSNSYFGTQSPGDAWSWKITKDASGNRTFSGTDNTTAATYSGDVTTLSNKYLQLTITATTDNSVVVGSSGATFYALEFPETALLLKPAGTNDSVVVAAAEGDCPSPSSYNWVKVANQSWSVTSDPAYGTTTTTGSASSLNFSVVPYLLDGTLLSSVAFSGSCSNGVISSTDNTTFAVTPSGVFVADQGTAGGILISA